MKKITTLKLKKQLDNSYPIFIGNNCQNDIIKYLLNKKIGQKYAIITDNVTERLYGKKLKEGLKKANIISEIFSFSGGERNKNIQTIENLAQSLLNKNIDRKDAIIALGGGVVGDIAGFLAGIYMRGIPYAQIPTTLMAMVDSSIGGKTGVDLPEGKNLLGLINQPQAIFIDTNYLKTLPQKQIRNGLAEVIKYAVICDEKLFKYIEQDLSKIFALNSTVINKIIQRSVEIKSEIVEKDETENNLRMTLNYGHTFGHAIEKISNYQLLHGHAISIGMILANKMAVEKRLLSKTASERIKNLLKAAGLPITTMHPPTKKDFLTDKKKAGNTINFILPTKIGKVVIYPEKI